MRADRSGWCKNNFFLEDIIVRNKVQKNVEQGISAAAGCIAKRLYRHQLPEWNIKKVDNRKYPASQHARKNRKRTAMILVNKVISLIELNVKRTYLFSITPSTCKKLRIATQLFHFKA